MVTDTGKTIENPKEHIKKSDESRYEYFKKWNGQGGGCVSYQVCPECGAYLYDSLCFCIRNFDCPRCGHKERLPKFELLPFNGFQITGDGIGFFDKEYNFPLSDGTRLLSADEYNFQYQG